MKAAVELLKITFKRIVGAAAFQSQESFKLSYMNGRYTHVYNYKIYLFRLHFKQRPLRTNISFYINIIMYLLSIILNLNLCILILSDSVF